MVHGFSLFILSVGAKAQSEAVALLALRSPEDAALVQQDKWLFGSHKKAVPVKGVGSDYLEVEEAHSVVWPMLAMAEPYFDNEEAAASACTASKSCRGFVQHKHDGSPHQDQFTLFEDGGDHELTKSHHWISELKVKKTDPSLVQIDNQWFFKSSQKVPLKKAPSKNVGEDQLEAQTQSVVDEPKKKMHKRPTDSDYVEVQEAHNVVWPYLASATPEFVTEEETVDFCNEHPRCIGYVQHKPNDGPHAGLFTTFTEGGKHFLTKEHDWISQLRVKKSHSMALMQTGNDWWFVSKKSAPPPGYEEVDEVADTVWLETTYYASEQEALAACNHMNNCRGFVRRKDDGTPNGGKYSLFQSGGDHIFTKAHDWIANLKVKP